MLLGLQVTVPINTRATMFIAASQRSAVKEASSSSMTGFRYLRTVNGSGSPPVPLAVFEVESGRYCFTSEY